MQPTFAAGLLLTVAGIGGYAAGIYVPYPGRSFSLTALMAGVTLALIGRSGGGP